MNSLKQNTRIFPELAEDFYSAENENEADSDRQTARLFLALRHENLNFFQRSSGIGLSRTSALARLVKLHAAAVENELKGETTRADYFWRRFLDAMNRAKDDSALWRNFLETADPGKQNRILQKWDEFPRAFIREVALPFQLGFYAGYLTESEDEQAAGRAALHLKYFAELDSICSYDETVRITFPQVEEICHYLAERGRIFAALDLCEILRRNISGLIEWQTLFLSLKRDAVFAVVEHMQNEPEMQESIQYFIDAEQESLRDKWNLFKNNLAYYNVRADFYYLQAGQMTNAGYLGAALKSTQIALAFQPLHNGSRELFDALLYQIEVIKAQYEADETGQALPAAFIRQVSEALEYPDSREARNVIESRAAAVALAIWNRIGLEKQKGFMERAAALTGAINQIFAAPPENEQQLRQAWFEQHAPELHFSSQENEKIFEYLRENLFAPSEPVIEAEKELPPIFAAPSPAAMPQEVEWGYWLFGPEDRGLKIRTAVSVSLVLLIAFLITHEYTTSFLRNRSYWQLREAVQQHDYRHAAEAAENFLSYSSYWGADNRQKRVLSFYDEAVLRLILEQPGEQIPEEIKALVARHEQLIQKFKPPDRQTDSSNANNSNQSPTPTPTNR